jgi:SpoVK/Ycf46/Vps4 family AAA+-type ATPase
MVDDADDNSLAEALAAIDAELEEIRVDMPLSPALEMLCKQLDLDGFERDILLLCAGVELDGGIADFCAGAAQMSRHPTLELLLNALPDAHWNALSPASALRGWRLVDVASGLPAMRRPVQIDERALSFLLGINYLDQRLEGIVAPLDDVVELPEADHAIVAKLVGLLVDGSAPVMLTGGDSGSKASLAAMSAAALGGPGYAIRLTELPTTAQECSALARLCNREALMTGAIFFIDVDAPDDREQKKLDQLVGELVAPLVVATTRATVIKRPVYRINIPRPDREQQRALWQNLLPDDLPDVDHVATSISASFDLDTAGIRTAAMTLRGLASDGDDTDALLRTVCREQTRERLDELAERIEPLAGWSDLVLRESQIVVLREIGTHMRHRDEVYETWGFAGKSNRGLGITALFAGPSGTGKTMAAEVLAGELALDLYRIDLSQVVSKFIGETEKNLKRVFDAADQSGAILLFDEADALFGKRSEVKDSHDRYANIEVSYLLQRMECYRGLAILTSNMKDALDEAFLRRIRFIVNFPFPGIDQRKEIWQGIFPKAAPTEDLDPERLAQLDIAGGNIRNIALNAAFLAAADGGSITRSEILRAARGEYAKRDRTVSDAETKGWQ